MGVEIVAQPLGDRVRPLEGPLHGDLLIEQHPHEQRQATAAEKLVGLGTLC